MTTIDGLPGLGFSTRVMLADEVYAVMQQAILDGTLPPNTRVNAGELARQFDVSPTPVREALARLESDGLVEKHALKGYRTSDLLNREQLREMFELRLLLEPGTAAHAAARRTQEQLDALVTEIDLGRQAVGTDDAYALLSQHDVRLHDLVFRAAGNATALTAYNRTHCHLHTYRLAYTGTYVPDTVEEHAQIVTAIAAGDAAAAESAMRSHIENSATRLLVTLDS